VKTISHKVLDQLSLEASGSERLRKNLNLHDDYGSALTEIVLKNEAESF